LARAKYRSSRGRLANCSEKPKRPEEITHPNGWYAPPTMRAGDVKSGRGEEQNVVSPRDTRSCGHASLCDSCRNRGRPKISRYLSCGNAK
jgi:hypothetical protein